MNKKLLVAAVGATFAALPVLSAQAAKVKVYGKAEVEVVSIDSTTGAVPDRTEQGDAGGRSRWGVKASQDLGNGMKAIAKFEFKLNPSNGSDESNREQSVGLKGSFGTVKLGRLPGTYKMFGGVKWDPYTGTFMEARRSGGMSGDGWGHNGFINDMIEYTTPKGLGGVTVQAQYIVDESAGDDGSYQVGFKWKGGPIEVIAVTNNRESKDATNSKVGVRYKAGGFTVFGQYEDVENGGSIRVNGHKLTKVVDGNHALLGVGYKFGNNVVHGNVGSFDGDVASSPDTDYLAVGITHFFSKKTRVYAGFANTDQDGVDDVDMWGAGIRFDF